MTAMQLFSEADSDCFRLISVVLGRSMLTARGWWVVEVEER
jgi:hypothetical protein